MMSLNIAERMLQLLLLPALLYQPIVSYNLGGDSVIYTTYASFYSCHFSTRALDHYGSIPFLYWTKGSLTTDSGM